MSVLTFAFSSEKQVKPRDETIDSCGLNPKCHSLDLGFAEVAPAAEYNPHFWQVCVVFTCVYVCVCVLPRTLRCFAPVVALRLNDA